MLSFKLQASKDEGGQRDFSLRVKEREELVILLGMRSSMEAMVESEVKVSEGPNNN